MRWSHDRRLARAGELASKQPESEGLLRFYRSVATLQKTVFEAILKQGSSDLGSLEPFFPALKKIAAREGPPALSSAAVPSLDLMRAIWEGPEPESEPASEVEKFLGRALVQPFAEALATRGEPDPQTEQPTCPFCSAKPVLGVLRREGEGAKRSLLCSLCATEWEYRRILCPSCGEEDKERLPVYQAEQLDSVRIEACDTCRSYLKSIDLTKNGHAVPVVDDIASAALTLWAEEQGYSRLETNLLGM